MKTSGIGRNDPCPCGSGKKFRLCCLGKESGTASGHGAAGKVLAVTGPGRSISASQVTVHHGGKT
jgi:hypothetical protein